jgi:hypothetical protein
LHLTWLPWLQFELGGCIQSSSDLITEVMSLLQEGEIFDTRMHLQ